MSGYTPRATGIGDLGALRAVFPAWHLGRDAHEGIRVAAELVPPDAGAPWADRLRHIAGEWRRIALAHPHVFPLLATGPPPSPAPLLPVIDATLGALRVATKDDDGAISLLGQLAGLQRDRLLSDLNVTLVHTASMGSRSPVCG